MLTSTNTVVDFVGVEVVLWAIEKVVMSGMQVAALVIILIGVTLTIACVAMPKWEKNDPGDTNNDAVQKINGLWMKCTTYATGNWDCDDYDRIFLGLPTRLQAARMLGIGSILTGIVAFFLLMIGIECIPVGTGSQKRTFRIIAGSLAVFSSGFLLVATSWYARDITRNFELTTQQISNNMGTNNQRYIFGEALFIGWAGSVMTLIGGLVALCTGCSGSDSDDFNDQPRGYVYHPPPAKAPNVNVQEYV